MRYFFTFFLLFFVFNLTGMINTAEKVPAKLPESSITSPLAPYFPKVLQILIAQYAAEWQLRHTSYSYAGIDGCDPDSLIAFSDDENLLTTCRYLHHTPERLAERMIVSENITTQEFTGYYYNYPTYERTTLSPTGKYTAHISSKQNNWTCKVVDLLKGTIKEFALPATTYQAIESRYLFEDKYLFFSLRGSIISYDLRTKKLDTWQTPQYYADQLICSPNGKYLFAHVIDFTFRARSFLILDVTHRNQVACIPDQDQPNGARSEFVAAFSPDSSTLTICGTALAFYHILRKQEPSQTSYLSAITRQELTEKMAFKSLCYSQDGAFIALGARNYIVILHRDQDNIFRTCQIIQINKWDQYDQISQLHFSRSGKYLVSGHTDEHVLKLWENYALNLVEKEQKK